MCVYFVTALDCAHKLGVLVQMGDEKKKPKQIGTEISQGSTISTDNLFRVFRKV